jgi:hypothetical protein
MGNRRGKVLPGGGPKCSETGKKFKKDVNLEGTNPKSPLESTKVSKNEPKTT